MTAFQSELVPAALCVCSLSLHFWTLFLLENWAVAGEQAALGSPT